MVRVGLEPAFSSTHTRRRRSESRARALINIANLFQKCTVFRADHVKLDGEAQFLL